MRVTPLAVSCATLAAIAWMVTFGARPASLYYQGPGARVAPHHQSLARLDGRR